MEQKKGSPKIVIVGGVAGGAAAAARARRMSETAEIIMIDKGPYVSFASCALAYYVGDVIKDEKKMLVASPQKFRNRFEIDVRVNNEVLKVDPKEKAIEIKDLVNGRIYTETYDSLLLAPGARPFKPPIPGVDSPGVFCLRSIPDSRWVRDWITKNDVKHATVVGGGFIGLESAENLVGRGIKVTLIEGGDHVMGPLDPEMLYRVHNKIREEGVNMILNDILTSIKPEDGKSTKLSLLTKKGKKFTTDMVIMSVGVRPETTLAKMAGIKLGQRGGILIDERCKTNVDSIWACGDACETKDWVTGQRQIVALAGPASRQGRVAADSMILGENSRLKFRGTQGTFVCGIFGMTVASTGINERTAKRLGLSYETLTTHPAQHVSYYPGAKMMDLKVIYDPKKEGKLLGAQCVGEEGCERRIDIIAAFIQKGGSVFDLEEAELCYAPQYGAARDPVDMAGFVGANSIRGDSPLAHWESLDGSTPLVDVREVSEFAAGHVPGAVNIPLNTVRDRLDEFEKLVASQKDGRKDIYINCQVGQRGHYATRVLRLNGFNAMNVTGGYRSYLAFKQYLEDNLKSAE
eukprot:CAMPEP_0114511094 /NCGR_PEP_ID=MMETSP0109-20121206/14163_1 /TAXON_ID=29199 /ORGANISM="Chlorarachnion reptans, Strain CCCM449" /LENGTH=575 /DNA_ID=CAMNT_0001690497 /DNA_START=68 /DNA_END=1798 /DNA_ORIENTATION=+